jgi:hypothetical protein
VAQIITGIIIIIGMATLKGCKRRDYQNQLWSGYHGKEEKEDIEEIHGWKVY